MHNAARGGGLLLSDPFSLIYPAQKTPVKANCLKFYTAVSRLTHHFLTRQDRNTH